MKSKTSKLGRLVLVVIMLLLAGVVALSSAVPAAMAVATETVTVTVKDSNNLPISGARVEYEKGSSGYYNLGDTDGSGQVVAQLDNGATYNFRVKYNRTTSQVETRTITGPTAVDFATFKAEVHVIDSGGGNIEGARVDYNRSGWYLYGNTDSSGIASLEVFDSQDLEFRAIYNRTTSVTQTVPVSTAVVATFQTDKAEVHVIDSGGGNIEGARVDYNRSGWYLYGNTDSSGIASLEVFDSQDLEFRAIYNRTTSVTQTVPVSTAVVATFQTDKAEVHVIDSGGGNIEGARVDYNRSGWYLYGNTDSSGIASLEVFDSQDLEFRAIYNRTTSVTQTVPVSTAVVATFQTENAEVYVTDCSSSPIAGARVEYNRSGWYYYGDTNAAGIAALELFDSEQIDFRVKLNRTTSGVQTATIDNGKVAEFQPTLVTLYYSGTIRYNTGGGYYTFTSPMYLFPGSYSFKFDSYETTLAIAGCAQQQVVNILKLKDHNGSPLAGGTARVVGAAYGTWFVPGSTDANGVVMDIRTVGSGPANMSYEMRYNNTTTHLTQDVSVNSVFEFQTNLLTLRLETSDGVPLDGGGARYGIGAAFGTWFFPGGATGSSAPGETAAELFPGTYSFEMGYQSTATVKSSIAVPAADTTLTWQTTTVNLQFSGDIAYGGGTGDSRFFNKPTMELLQGTFKFNFRPCARTDITIPAAPSLTLSYACVKLLDNGGNGLSGGTVKYYDGGWKVPTPNTTDANGAALFGIEGLKGNLKFRMTYNDGSQEKWQNIASDSFVIFQTDLVTFDLLDSSNAALAGTAKYYAGGWHQFGSGTTPTSMQLLPANYKFRVSYGGASEEKWQNVGTNPAVVFQTKLVTFKLLASDGSTPLAGDTKYYAGGWHQFGGGTSTATMELLPVNHKFRITYGGASEEKWQNVGADANVIFQTELVTFKLLDSNGSTQLAGETKYYAGGWHQFGGGTSTATMELLPVNHKFRITYGGASEEKWQNVGADANVIFQTELVTFKLLDSNGSTQLAGETKYYAGGWHQFGGGTSTATMELLPVNHKFRITYGGASEEKWQNVGTNSAVVFQTKLVTFKLLASDGSTPLAGDTKYYAGGWHQFGGGTSTATMELLPVNYKFRITYGGGSEEKWQNVGINNAVTFQTGKVHSVSGAATFYYASGWQTFVQDMELLPLRYKFRFNDASPEAYYTIAAATVNNIH